MPNKKECCNFKSLYMYPVLGGMVRCFSPPPFLRTTNSKFDSFAGNMIFHSTFHNDRLWVLDLKKSPLFGAPARTQYTFSNGYLTIDIPNTRETCTQSLRRDVLLFSSHHLCLGFIVHSLLQLVHHLWIDRNMCVINIDKRGRKKWLLIIWNCGYNFWAISNETVLYMAIRLIPRNFPSEQLKT